MKVVCSPYLVPTPPVRPEERVGLSLDLSIREARILRLYLANATEQLVQALANQTTFDRVVVTTEDVLMLQRISVPLDYAKGRDF